MMETLSTNVYTLQLPPERSSPDPLMQGSHTQSISMTPTASMEGDLDYVVCNNMHRGI